jgi:beta-galactosidase/beta-glucuronidase
VDSTERNDIPPFGYEIDYLTFGGIYREVNLRIVPALYIENMVARAVDPLTENLDSRERTVRNYRTPRKTSQTRYAADRN